MAGSLPLMIEDGGSEPAKRAVTQLPALVVDERKLFVFTQLWTQHQGSVQAYLASFLGNTIEVDDALQKAAMVAWQKEPWDEEPSAFLGYCLTYTRRMPSLTGLTHRIMTSTDLTGWTEDYTATQTVTGTTGGLETVEVTLSNSPLSDPKLFIRVRAQ